MEILWKYVFVPLHLEVFRDHIGYEMDSPITLKPITSRNLLAIRLHNVYHFSKYDLCERNYICVG